MISWERIIELLTNDGPLTPLEIKERTGLAQRTVNSALRRLLDMKAVERLPNFSDMRRPIYRITGDKDGQ